MEDKTLTERYGKHQPIKCEYQERCWYRRISPCPSNLQECLPRKQYLLMDSYEERISRIEKLVKQKNR